jgi:NitT/TauT family transport system ATP-binding protein
MAVVAIGKRQMAEGDAVVAPRAAAAQPAVLKFDSIGFAYDGRDVLKNVSFSVAPGEFVAVLGPSGCGKTTILNLIAGFLAPTEGCAFVDGRLIEGPGPDRGVVFQSYALFDWMTVLDNIAFSLKCAGRPRSEQIETGRRMAKLVGLEGVEKLYPYQLSGGMRQRCGLARVLAASPRVMLMDEPFAAVDVQTRETLQEEILRIRHETGCTIVFVTHSVDEAVFLADRIFLMSNLAGGQYRDIPVKLPEPRWNTENRLSAEFLRLREQIYIEMRTVGHASAHPAQGPSS